MTVALVATVLMLLLLRLLIATLAFTPSLLAPAAAAGVVVAVVVVVAAAAAAAVIVVVVVVVVVGGGGGGGGGGVVVLVAAVAAVVVTVVVVAVVAVAVAAAVLAVVGVFFVVVLLGISYAVMLRVSSSVTSSKIMLRASFMPMPVIISTMMSKPSTTWLCSIYIICPGPPFKRSTMARCMPADPTSQTGRGGEDLLLPSLDPFLEDVYGGSELRCPISSEGLGFRVDDDQSPGA